MKAAWLYHKTLKTMFKHLLSVWKSCYNEIKTVSFSWIVVEDNYHGLSFRCETKADRWVVCSVCTLTTNRDTFCNNYPRKKSIFDIVIRQNIIVVFLVFRPTLIFPADPKLYWYLVNFLFFKWKSTIFNVNKSHKKFSDLPTLLFFWYETKNTTFFGLIWLILFVTVYLLSLV